MIYQFEILRVDYIRTKHMIHPNLQKAGCTCSNAFSNKTAIFCQKQCEETAKSPHFFAPNGSTLDFCEVENLMNH